MNVDIANALSGYIEVLYELNIKIIRLCGFDIMTSNRSGDKELLDIIQDIPRVIPYSYDSKTDGLSFDIKDGLLEFEHEIPYLRAEYDKILSANYKFLDKVRKIRNKHVHKMHGIKYSHSTGGSDGYFDFAFDINNTKYEINSKELIKFAIQTNILFSKIIKEIRTFAYENKKNEYPYYKRIMSFDFKEFNTIYESTLLTKVGRLLHSF